MKPENYKLALRRARKAAKKILEANDNIIFEAIDKRRHPVLISISHYTGLVRVIYIYLENEKIKNVIDNCLPSNIIQEIWVKQHSREGFKAIIQG